MIGRTLGHYEIVEKLGEGGMGAVCRARDTTLGRDVAVKLLPGFVSGDSEKIARLEREARLLASLSHPNIATLHSVRAVTETHRTYEDPRLSPELKERVPTQPR